MGHHLSLISPFTEWVNHILPLVYNNIYGTKKRTFICRLYQHLQYEGTIYCRLYQQHFRHEETDHHLSLISTFTVWVNHILSLVSTTFTARRNGPSFVAYINIYGMRELYIVSSINNIFGTKKRTIICPLYQHLRYEGTIYCPLYQQHLRHEETDHHLLLISTFTVWGYYILSLVSTTFMARGNGPSIVV